MITATARTRVGVSLTLCLVAGCTGEGAGSSSARATTVCRPIELSQPHLTLAQSLPLATATAPARGFDLALCERDGSSWRRITDRRNQKHIDLERPPRRIISQALGSDEFLFAIIPEPQRRRLIAVSALAASERYSDVVDQARAVGRFVTDKTEDILALSPDLVFAASYTTPETLRQLDNANVPTIVLHQFTGIADAIENLHTIAFALYLDAEGSRLANDLLLKLETARNLLDPILQPADGSIMRIPVLAYGSGTVYAQGTTFNDVAVQLGMTNMPATAGLKGWPRADQEQLLAWKPRFVFLSAPLGAQDRSASFFRREFPEFFRTPSPPTIIVLPEKLFSTVSQRLGDLAMEVATRTFSVLDAQPRSE